MIDPTPHCPLSDTSFPYSLGDYLMRRAKSYDMFSEFLHGTDKLCGSSIVEQYK